MATRFYPMCPSGSTSPMTYFSTGGITPAFNASWDDTSLAVRSPMYTVSQLFPDSIGILECCTGTQDFSYSDLTGALLKRILMLQLISTPLKAQTIGVQTFTACFQGSETNALNNMFIYYTIRAVSEDGSTTTGTLLALTADDVELTTTLTSRAFSATTTSVTLNANDRLVIEIGLGGTPTASVHSSTLRVLEDFSVSDLTGTDAQTTTGASWFNFGTTSLTLNSCSNTQIATNFGRSTNSVLIGRLRGMFRTVTATSTGVSVLTKLSGRFRSITSSATGVAVLSKFAGFQQIISNVGTGIAVLSKLASRFISLNMTATGTAVVSQISNFFRGIASQAVGLCSVTNTAGFQQTLAMTAVGIMDLIVVPGFQIGYEFLYNIWLLAGRRSRQRKR